MDTILISGASGIVGYGILKSLRMSGKPLNLIGTTIYDDSIAQAFCDTFIKAPLTDNKDYFNWLMSIIQEHKIDMVIPGIDADMYAWSDNLDMLEQSGAKILLNRSDLISLCKDKWSFYNTLKKHNCAYVIPSSLSDGYEDLKREFGVPFLLKPRKGFGSKGIVRVYDEVIFDLHKENIGKILLAQPLIGNDDEEYTTSAFCDGNEGFYALMTLKRKLSKDGYTEKAEVIEIKGIEEAVLNICKIFNPLGPTNFQFRIHEGIFKLLEINPRISSSTSIRSSFGYNESEMAIEYFLKGKMPIQPKIKKGRAVRYVEDFIFYT